MVNLSDGVNFAVMVHDQEVVASSSGPSSHLNAETEPSGVHVVDRSYSRSRRVAGLGWVNDMVLPDCAVGLLSSEHGNLPYNLTLTADTPCTDHSMITQMAQFSSNSMSIPDSKMI